MLPPHSRALVLSVVIVVLLLTITHSSINPRRISTVASSPQDAQAPSIQPVSLSRLRGRAEPFLSDWESRKIATIEESFANNNVSCPIWMEEQSNPKQLLEELQNWETLSHDTIVSERSQAIKGVRNLLKGADENEGADRILGNGSRGIVVTGGNADTMSRILVMLKVLRKHHRSQLLVEVWAFEEETQNADFVKIRVEVEKLGGVTFRQFQSQKVEAVWKNFQIKAEAIIQSSFSQVLYLDSDNLPLVDPAYLFDSPKFHEYGVVLWPDITKDGPRNPIWRIADQTCIPQDWQIDSGQILIDKRAQRGLVGIALLLAGEMQKQWKFWFKLTNGGDKDTFVSLMLDTLTASGAERGNQRYAFYALRLPWGRAPHWLSPAGADHGSGFCGHTMLQYGLDPSDWKHFPNAKASDPGHAPPLFAHANLLKHSGDTFDSGALWTVVQRAAPSDDVSRVNLDVMNRIKAQVYEDTGIMCIIMSLVNDGGVRDADKGVQVLEERWDGAWTSGVTAAFERAYVEEGGRLGYVKLWTRSRHAQHFYSITSQWMEAHGALERVVKWCSRGADDVIQRIISLCLATLGLLPPPHVTIMPSLPF